MTADIEMLPCPFCGGTSTLTDKDSPICPVGHILCDDCYASADSTRWNQRATAAKAAEIERLRAEVEAVWAALPRDARYLDPPDGGCVPLHEQVRRMAADATRAERMAEALRELRDLMLGQVKWMPCDCGCPQQRTPDGPHSVTWLRAAQQVEIAIGKAEGKE